MFRTTTIKVSSLLGNLKGIKREAQDLQKQQDYVLANIEAMLKQASILTGKLPSVEGHTH